MIKLVSTRRLDQSTLNIYYLQPTEHLGKPRYLKYLIHLQCGRPGFNPWVGKTPWRREQLSVPVFWPGEFRGLYSPVQFSRSVMSDSLRLHGLYSPWHSPGQNTGVGSLSLLQGIFPTQGLNPGLPHCRWILYQLSHKGSPRILEWVAYPFSSGSSQPRNQTGVSCIAGGFFTC